MNDPKRLLDGDGTAFERALLGAIASERPSRDLHRKMRLGIGLVGVGAVAKAASASWNQLALAGAVVVGLVTGGAVVAKRVAKEEAPSPIVAPASTPAPVVREAKPVEPIPVTVPETPKAAEPEPARRDAKVAPVADIREEIRLLDQARSAVRSGNNGQALRALARYDQKFPRGQFRQEVQVLRMEALKQSGEKERAAVLAKKFLNEHPNSPHVERVERVGN
ncbi:MAG TPA: outer membrane protein assembly factor BamD [Polyangiaceae bacterium]